MDKLLEMTNAGIKLTIYNPVWHYNYEGWEIKACKSDDGANLELVVQHRDLQSAIDDIYERWIVATRGLPSMSLKQIEHVVPSTATAFDNEIPF